jgi:hypothetical protein
MLSRGVVYINLLLLLLRPQPASVWILRLLWTYRAYIAYVLKESG